jgi:hypothetical protein
MEGTTTPGFLAGSKASGTRPTTNGAESLRSAGTCDAPTACASKSERTRASRSRLKPFFCALFLVRGSHLETRQSHLAEAVVPSHLALSRHAHKRSVQFRRHLTRWSTSE